MGRKKRKRKRANEKEKLETLAQAAGAYSNYRPHMNQAANRALHQQMAAFQPANNVLGMMYGAGMQGSGAGMGGIITPEMLQVGQTSKAPGVVEGADSEKREVARTKPGKGKQRRVGKRSAPTRKKGG